MWFDVLCSYCLATVVGFQYDGCIAANSMENNYIIVVYLLLQSTITLLLTEVAR